MRALSPCQLLVRLMFNRSSEAASSLAVHLLCALQQHLLMKCARSQARCIQHEFCLQVVKMSMQKLKTCCLESTQRLCQMRRVD